MHARRLNVSNLNLTVAVEIVIRIIKDHSLTKLGPISGVKPDMFI